MKNTNRAQSHRFAAFVIEEQLNSELETREELLVQEALDDQYIYSLDLLRELDIIGGRYSDIGMKPSRDMLDWDDDEWPLGSSLSELDQYDRLCEEMYYSSISLGL